MTAKRSHPRIPILLRLEPEELALIDDMRGAHPRSTWMVQAAIGAAQTELVIRKLRPRSVPADGA